ncbi:Uncharacterised protein [Dorea longicatena]|nr:Uncharacterised protein [Dorea longicatena]
MSARNNKTLPPFPTVAVTPSPHREGVKPYLVNLSITYAQAIGI